MTALAKDSAETNSAQASLAVFVGSADVVLSQAANKISVARIKCLNMIGFFSLNNAWRAGE